MWQVQAKCEICSKTSLMHADLNNSSTYYMIKIFPDIAMIERYAYNACLVCTYLPRVSQLVRTLSPLQLPG